jgi:transglutaminase-like putative cysteine protease
MRLTISHTTRYSYETPSAYGLQQLRLTPPTRNGQKVEQWMLNVDGGVKEAEFLDQHDNLVTLVNMAPDRRDILVQSMGMIETTDLAGVVGQHTGRAPVWYYSRGTPTTTAGPLVHALVGALAPETNEVTKLHALSSLILERVPYQIGETHSATSAEEALEGSRGVCQDHTHIFISAARLMGFPARYVSGYLVMPEQSVQSAGHAWAEAHVSGLGWVGFDVSNSVSPDERYVAVSTGLDSAEAAPVKGLMHARGGEALDVTIQIQQQ